LPVGLRTPAVVAGSTLLLGSLAWFGAELGGDRVGLAERVAAGAQSLWPLVVVLSARAARRHRVEVTERARPPRP
jgi:hypothetical protein